MAVITIFYLATTSHSPEIIKDIWDKLKHSSAFFVLFVLYRLGYPLVPDSKRVLDLILFGFLIEIVQYFLPMREFSLLDIIANICGLFLARTLLWKWRIHS
jgi:VanZ family protein